MKKGGEKKSWATLSWKNANIWTEKTKKKGREPATGGKEKTKKPNHPGKEKAALSKYPNRSYPEGREKGTNSSERIRCILEHEKKKPPYEHSKETSPLEITFQRPPTRKKNTAVNLHGKCSLHFRGEDHHSHLKGSHSASRGSQ